MKCHTPDLHPYKPGTGHTLVSSRAMTPRRSSPNALAMSASTDASPCGGMKKIRVAGLPAVLLIRAHLCKGSTAHEWLLLSHRNLVTVH